MRRKFSHWYSNLDILDPKLHWLMNSGYAVIPKERDEHGRQLMLLRPAVADPDIVKSSDIVRFISVVYESFLQTEIFQVAGIVFVIDGSNLSLKVLSQFSVIELNVLFSTLQNLIPIRLKQIHIINVPPIASFLAKIIFKMAPAKIQKRIFFHNSMEDFKKKFNCRLLPKEYGGEVPMSEVIKQFGEDVVKNRDFFVSYDRMFEINYKKIKSNNYNISVEVEDQFVGDLRNMEID